jgi:hypothetical protein
MLEVKSIDLHYGAAPIFPLIPAPAGIQLLSSIVLPAPLGPRFRGDERRVARTKKIGLNRCWK